MNNTLTASAWPRKQLATTAAMTLLAVAMAVLFYAVNPMEWWFLPPCQFHKITGLHCPGCGATRATYHLLHGHILTALRCNVLLTLVLPVVATVSWWRWWRSAPPLDWKPAYTWLLLGGLLAFGVLRNLPFYPCTLLAP